MDESNPLSSRSLPWEIDFGHNLQTVREEAGLTHYALAKDLRKVGLPFHPQLIDRIERAERPVRLNEAVVIARYFGRAVDEMFDASLEAPSRAEHVRRTLEDTAQLVEDTATVLRRSEGGLERARERVSAVEALLESADSREDPAVKELTATASAMSAMVDYLLASLGKSVRAAERSIDEAARRSPDIRAWIGIQ